MLVFLCFLLYLDFGLMFSYYFVSSLMPLRHIFFPNIASIFYYFQWENGPNYLDNNIAVYWNIPQLFFF